MRSVLSSSEKSGEPALGLQLHKSSTMMPCEYPNGRMRRTDGTTYPIACDNSACREVDGWWFCAEHAGMAERGCLNHYYNDGTTLREAMHETALYRLIRRSNGETWQGFPPGNS